MKTIQEVLEWIDYVEQNAHLRPQFYVQVPIALEDLLLNINNLKYMIIDEEGLYERESYCKFLRTKGYGAYCFIQKNQLNQQANDSDVRQADKADLATEFCDFWQDYLEWRSNFK
ncbi:hypothetical protein [Gimesia sp.]|uniref:hypothetical protein n=1 Tax=Gimesia sp. TaxID=2024833 RepID=UPI003A93495A